MTFAFRWRFVLGPHMRINCRNHDLVLAADSEDVRLRSAESAKTIQETEQIALWGRPYVTQEQALEAGAKWISWLQVAFARVNLGADLGGLTPHSAFTEAGLAELEATDGLRTLNDIHGLMAFEEEPPPVFVSRSLDYYFGKSPDRLCRGLNEIREQSFQSDERHRLAYDLYSTSFFASSADVRCLTLVMAIETLAEKRPHSGAVLALVNYLIDRTKTADLGDQAKQSLLGSLQWLRTESIIAACTRMVTTRLAERCYGGEEAGGFFKRSYELRSKLVHGALPRPSRSEVDARAAELERLVGDVLA